MQKNRLNIVGILMLLSTLIFAQKPSVIIMDFKGNGIAHEELRVFTEHLQVELFNLDQFTIIEKSQIRKKLSDIDRPDDDHSSAEYLTEAGSMSDADYIIGGSITKIDDRFSVTVRMIDNRNKEVIRMFVYYHSGDIISLLSDGAEEIAGRLSEPIVKIESQTPDSTNLAKIIIPQDGKPVTSTRSPGGIGPALGSCLIGPRVGLEMNEGNDEIYLSEWIALGGSMVSGSATGVLAPLGSAIYTGSRAYMAYDMGGQSNGLEGALASYFLGPRVGKELHYRKIRKNEWLQLCCIGRIFIVAEAYNGKTMTEIEIEEGLRK